MFVRARNLCGMENKKKERNLYAREEVLFLFKKINKQKNFTRRIKKRKDFPDIHSFDGFLFRRNIPDQD